MKYFGLIILVIILSKIDIILLKDEILKTNLPFLFIAMALNIPHLFIKSYRWNLMLKQQNICFSPMQTFFAYMSSLYIGFITPGRLGEFVKVLYLKSGRGISISKGFSSVLGDRLFDLYLLIVLGSIGLWKFDVLGELSDVFLVFTIIVLLSPLIMLNKKLTGKLIKILYNLAVIKKVKDKIEESFEEFFDGLNQLINLQLLVSGLLTFIGYFMFFIQCYLIVLAMDLPINFITITFFMSISNLISFIPISISGLGTRDATLIYLFSLFGLRSELAVSYASLVFVTFFVFGGLIGALAWFRNPLEINIGLKPFRK